MIYIYVSKPKNLFAFYQDLLTKKGNVYPNTVLDKPNFQNWSTKM